MALVSGVSHHYCYHYRKLFFIDSHHRHGRCFFYSKILPPFKSRELLSGSPIICRPRFQSLLKSASDKKSSTLPQSPPQKSQPSDADTRTKFSECDDVQGPSFPSLLGRLWEEFKLDGLGLEILSIAMPAALALLADPITSLVDSAFVGHLGSVELAAVGVSVSVFNLVSKLFNVPLLNITTSFIAEEQALITKAAKESSPSVQEGKLLLPSVSTSLALATGLGIAQAIALSIGSGFLMNTMGFTNVHAS